MEFIVATMLAGGLVGLLIAACIHGIMLIFLDFGLTSGQVQGILMISVSVLPPLVFASLVIGESRSHRSRSVSPKTTGSGDRPPAPRR